jgi:hypothetical protein
MQVKNEELRTTRELARETSAVLDALSKGDVQKIVVTQGGKIKAVIITPDHYDDLASNHIDVN